MKKSDLQTGMKVTTRNGEEFIVLCDSVTSMDSRNVLYSIFRDRVFNLLNFNENLTNKCSSCFDIINISVVNNYTIDNNKCGWETIWERREKVEVDFLTVIKAYSEGKAKTIWCDDKEFSVNDKVLGEVTPNEILNGKWYIECK